MCYVAGGLTERQMLQLALEESKNAALAAAAGKSEDSSEEENSDSDSDDGSSAHGAKAGGGKARRAKPTKLKSRVQHTPGATTSSAASPSNPGSNDINADPSLGSESCVRLITNFVACPCNAPIVGRWPFADHKHGCSTPRKRAKVEVAEVRTATSSENSKASRSTQLRDLVSLGRCSPCNTGTT